MLSPIPLFLFALVASHAGTTSGQTPFLQVPEPDCALNNITSILQDVNVACGEGFYSGQCDAMCAMRMATLKYGPCAKSITGILDQHDRVPNGVAENLAMQWTRCLVVPTPDLITQIAAESAPACSGSSVPPPPPASLGDGHRRTEDDGHAKLLNVTRTNDIKAMQHNRRAQADVTTEELLRGYAAGDACDLVVARQTVQCPEGMTAVHGTSTCSAGFKNASNTIFRSNTMQMSTCGAVAMAMVMPPDSGVYVYRFTIVDLGFHTNFGAILDQNYESVDYGAWPWNQAGIYTWCNCGDRWDHHLSGNPSDPYQNNDGIRLCPDEYGAPFFGSHGQRGLDAEVVASYDTATSSFTFTISDGNGCDGLTQNVGLRWSPGEAAHFQWGGCPCGNGREARLGGCPYEEPYGEPGRNTMQLTSVELPSGEIVSISALHAV